MRNFCRAEIKKVWRNFIEAKRLRIWVEITTLVIPGLNDYEDCLKGIAQRIRKELVEDTSWHLTRYYPAYSALEYGLYNGMTPLSTL